MAYTPPRRATGTQSDWRAKAHLIAPLAATLGLVGATAVQLPGAAVAWLVMLAGAFLAQTPALTGPKDTKGYPTPAGGGEKTRQDTFMVWRAMRTMLPTPALPAKTIPLAWLASWPAAALAWTMPADFDTPGLWTANPAAVTVLRAANALFCYQLVNQIPAARRKITGAPPVNLGVILDDWRHKAPVALLAAAAGGAGGWFGSGRLLQLLNAWTWWQTQHLHIAPQLMARIAATLVCALGAVAVMVAEESSRSWRARKAREQVWAPLWPQWKLDPPPQLLDTIIEKPWVTDVFTCPQGAQSLLTLGEKIRTLHPDGVNIALRPDPDPKKVAVICCQDRDLPDLAACDPDQAERLLNYGLARVAETMGGGNAHVTGVQPATQGEPVVYRAGLKGLDWASMRAGWADPLADIVGAQITVDDHNPPMLLAGDVDSVNPDDWNDPGMPARLDWLAYEDRWNHVWTMALKQTVNPPTPHSKLHNSLPLPDGPPIWCDGYQIREGLKLSSYLTVDEALITASGEPFLAVGRYTPNERGGAEDSRLLTVIHTAAVPPPISRLPKCDAGAWVLQVYLAKAFEAAGLTRPQVVQATCLTSPKAAQIWRVHTQLYGTDTVATVRAAGEKIRARLGVEYWRVSRSGVESQITITVGGSPSMADFTSPETKSVLDALDWEQAWVDAGVYGAERATPQLANAAPMPNNPLVTILDFKLPPALTLAKIKANLAKLQSTTGNAWIDAQTGPGGPETVRVMCAKQFPLPDMIPYRFDEATRGDKVAFATTVDGATVSWDPKAAPHLLVGGTTGAGKSGLDQALVTGMIRLGYQIAVIDLAKGAADFQPFRPWLAGCATTPREALALLRAVNTEMRRRVDLNAAHAVPNYLDLPPDLRPRPLVVFHDEFSSLTKQDQPGPASTDLALENARQEILATNRRLQDIGRHESHIAAEGRSAGVHLVASTQLLKTDMLDKLPGASDLKVNLSRLLLGNPAYGVRQAMLQHPDTSPDVGEVAHPGRGVYEPTQGPARLIQAWWAPVDQLVGWLAAQNIPPATPIDYQAFMDAEAAQLGVTEIGGDTTGGDPGEVLDLFGDMPDPLAPPAPRPPPQPAPPPGWAPDEPVPELDWGE